MYDSGFMEMFRSSLFTRIVPIVKDVGLWGKTIRDGYEAMGIIGFAQTVCRPCRNPTTPSPGISTPAKPMSPASPTAPAALEPAELRPTLPPRRWVEWRLREPPERSTAPVWRRASA